MRPSLTFLKFTFFYYCYYFLTEVSRVRISVIKIDASGTKIPKSVEV